MKRAALAVLGLVMLVPVVIVVRAGIYDSFVDNPLSGWGMWGTFVVHMATRPRRKEIGATVLLGLALRLAYDAAIGEKGYPGYWWIAMGTFLGLASLAVLAVQAVRPATERRAMIRLALGVIAIFNYLGICLSFYVSFARLALPHKLDYFLYVFDGSLGFQPSFALGKFVRAHSAVFWLLAMVYNSLGLWFCVIYAVHARAHGKFRFSIVRLFIANAFIGFSLYFLFPAMGPKYAFPLFPNLPPAVRPESVLLNGLPNAMPSLHFAGTVLIFWLARPWKWVRVVTGIVCALTAVATLGIGEHYLVDLVVALPYALAILALASNIRERRLPLLAGAAMVFAWLGMLRTGAFHPAVSWMLIILTAVACFRLERGSPGAFGAPPLRQRVDRRGVRRFVGRDLRCLLQDVAEFVDALHQAVLGECVDRELDRRVRSGVVSVWLGRSIFTDGAGAGGEQFRVHVRRHDDRQQRILQRVLLEDVGEAGADHRAEAALRQRPRSVLARTAAAEIVARQQHLRALRLAAG